MRSLTAARLRPPQPSLPPPQRNLSPKLPHSSSPSQPRPRRYYLFPPFWLPTYFLGICAAFLFDFYRPYEKHSRWMWGVLTDVLSFMLIFCGYVFYPLTATCVQHFQSAPLVVSQLSRL